MDRLLIITDDFTGALDTGVQFSKLGIETRVIADSCSNEIIINDSASVVVVNANSRHIEPEKAYSTVYETVKKFGKDFTHFYKKTDSALRGNIGSELSAILDATGCSELKFFPSFPKMNRYVQDGILYIEGTPVSESIFGSDLFNPVTESSVKEIIKSQTDKIDKIKIYDARTDKDLEKYAVQFGREGLKLCAGCAGFASALANELEMRRKEIVVPELEKGLFAVCGSINQVTVKQLEYAKSINLIRHTLSPKQKCDKNWATSSEASELVEQCLSEIKQTGCSIVDVDRTDREQETDELAQKLNLSVEELRYNISSSLGTIFKRVLEKKPEMTYMCIGGDTLEAAIRATGISGLTPLCELFPGVVLCEVCYGRKKIHLICKSGGFGQPDLLEKLYKTVMEE